MKRELKKQIQLAKQFSQEMKEIILSTCEDMDDAASITEAWDKIDRCYQSLERMRSRCTCTGSKSLGLNVDTKEGSVDGHTKYLQGINLPIYVNSIVSEDETSLKPSEISEMHIGRVGDKIAVLITPEIVG